ncbi:pyrroline-5-carboxylate reductase 3 [Protopterus annectens]|uniref:pyrroline-5-carboxylate reductase 3 n=1 Tax=Protopterus annectens TaxID=7888 RepID=UPI001CFB63ED|nr:pyrroline-5-carboxylate reductase 3 [Protopterus annectens]
MDYNGKWRVGFVGAGKMAFAIAHGIILTGKLQPSMIMASAPSDNNLGRFKEAGVETTHSNAAVVKGCQVIFLATKPHILPGVLEEISSLVTKEHIIISVAAGVTIQTLERFFPVGTAVVRSMPSLPCVVQESAIVFTRGSHAGDSVAALLKDLLSSCGLCEEVPESYIDIHTGLSGSGVAYVYMFAEAMAEGAVKMGMPFTLANKIAAQTLLGGAKMILETGDHPAKLKSDVCTPGGTTIHGLHELEKGSLRATVMNAVEAATTRARELGKK